MTYVILFDGFDTEGWESIQMLFEPSFTEDEVKIYSATSFGRAIEIDDIIDRNVQHTFIYLAVQKPRRKEKNRSLVETYRYKTLLDRIRDEFSYCGNHQNVLLVVDRIPKDIGNGLYVDQDKETALALDRFGYLDTHTDHHHYFTIDDIYAIKNKIFELIHTAERVTVDLFEKEIEEIVHQEMKKKIETFGDSEDAETCINRIHEVKKNFLKAFWQLDLSSFERREGLIENAIKRIFGETIGILGSLSSIAILTYRPTKIHEEDSKTHITIASLVSLIANRGEKVLQKGWFEIAKIEIDKNYLQRALEHLASIRLPVLHNEKVTVNIHNIEQLNHTLEPFKDENSFNYIEGVPWWYSMKKERGIKEEIDYIWNKMNDEIERLMDNLILNKNAIYGHPGAKTDKEFSYKEVKEESHRAVDDTYAKSTYTKEAIDEMLDGVDTHMVKGRFENFFDKLPGKGSYLLFMGIFTLIVLAVTAIPIEIWSKLLFALIGTTVVVALFVISFVSIYFFRKIP